MNEYEDIRKLEEKVDIILEDIEKNTIAFIVFNDRLRAMELTHQDLRDKIEKLEKWRVSHLIHTKRREDKLKELESFKQNQEDWNSKERTKRNKLKTLHAEWITEVEQKLQYVIDNYLMEFEPALTKLKELEQKLGVYRTYQINCSYNGDINYKHDFLEKKVDTLSAVIKDLIQWTHDYTYKIAISPPLMKPRLEEMLKKLDGTPKGAKEGEPSKKVIRCRSCNSTKVNYDEKEEFNCGCNVCGDVWNLGDEQNLGYPKEEQEYETVTDPITHVTVQLKKEAEPDLRNVDDAIYDTKQKLIAEFIKTLKQEIDYCKTINYYPFFDGKAVQCIPIKTLEEQFDRLIEELEGRAKSQRDET